MNSIRTNKGTRPNGVPAGIKKEKKASLCLIVESIVTPIKIVKLIPNDTIIEVVIV